MSAAFFCTCGHGTERMTGSAPGPAKVATRMVLLRMGFIRAPHKFYPASRAFPAWGQDGEYSLVGAARQSVASREGEAQDARRRISVAAFGRPSRLIRSTAIFPAKRIPLAAAGYLVSQTAFRGLSRSKSRTP